MISLYSRAILKHPILYPRTISSTDFPPVISHPQREADAIGQNLLVADLDAWLEEADFVHMLRDDESQRRKRDARFGSSFKGSEAVSVRGNLDFDFPHILAYDWRMFEVSSSQLSG